MPHRTRSIVLVLLGTGLVVPGCDDRQRNAGPIAPNADAGPSTRPTAYDDDGTGLGSSPPYGYGPMVHTTHPGIGWIGGTVFDDRRRYAWGGGYRWARPYADRRSTAVGRAYAGSSSSFSRTRSSGSSHTSDAGHGVTFGGFGEHASASHAAS